MAVGSAARVRLRRHEQAASKLADHSNWQGGQAAQTNSLTGQRRNGRINSPIERQHSTAGRGGSRDSWQHGMCDHPGAVGSDNDMATRQSTAHWW